MQIFKASAGFTLIELMFAVLVLGVLLGIGVPSMTAMVQDSRLSSQQRVLLGAINLARSEAVHRNQTVTLSHKSATAGDWSEGMLLYADATAAGNSAYNAADDTLIKDIDSFGEGVTIVSDTAGEGFISFRSNGMLNEGGNAVTLAICDERGASRGSAITISLSGRATVSGTATCDP